MVGLMLGVCSLMGLPWFVAATVLSITHVNSLKLESECSAPGEQPKFLGIREQRFTGLMIFTLMGCSVFMTSVLKVSLQFCLFLKFSCDCKSVLTLFSVHSYASVVWGVPLYGSFFSQRHSGKLFLSFTHTSCQNFCSI